MKIFITGVSDGIGEELARQLINAGHVVWGVARREELLKKIQSELGADKFLFSKCDVSNGDDVENTAKLMRSAGFIPDSVVLNAAVFYPDADSPYKQSVFKQAMEVNVNGSLIWIDKFLGDFLKRGSGSFIAISSVSAYLPNINSISYSAGKAALSMAFKIFRTRYQKEGVNFTTIYFGPVATKLIPLWSSEIRGLKNLFIISREEAAVKILKVINSAAGDYWFPFFTTLFFRVLSSQADIFSVFYRYFKNK